MKISILLKLMSLSLGMIGMVCELIAFWANGGKLPIHNPPQRLKGSRQAVTLNTKFPYLCAYRLRVNQSHVTCSLGKALMLLAGLGLLLLAIILFFWPEF